MALRDRFIPIRIGSIGLEEEADDRTLAPGTPTVLEDCVQRAPDIYAKRFGNDLLPRRVEAPTYAEVSGALGVASRDDGRRLCLLTSDDRVMQLGDDDVWHDVGPWERLRVDVTPAPRPPTEGWDQTCATVNGRTLLAWEDTRGGVYARFVSADGGAALAPEFKVGGHVSRAPRAEVAGNNILLLYVSGTQASPTLQVTSVSTAPGVRPPYDVVQVATDIRPGDYVARHPTYDTVSDGSKVYVAWSVSGSACRIAVLRPDGRVGVSGTFPALPSPTSWTEVYQGPCLALSGGLLAVGGVVVSDEGLAARVLRTSDLSVWGDIEVGVSDGPYQARRVSMGFDGSTLVGLVELSASDVSDRRVQVQTAPVIPSDAFSTYRSDIRHSSLGSKVFTLGGRPHVWLTQASPVQSTDFLHRLPDGLTVACSRPQLAVADVSGILGSVQVTDGTSALRAVCQADMLPGPEGSGSQFLRRHGRLQSVEYHPSSSWRPVDLDGALHLDGGWAGVCDGAQTFELTFPLVAEIPVVVPGSGSGLAGGGIGGDRPGWSADTGHYSYLAVPRFDDALGMTYRGVGIAVTASFTGSSTQVQNSASVYIRTFSHTLRDGTQARNSWFDVHRTSNNGDTWQLVGSVMNSTGSDRVLFVDTVAEGARGSGQEAYQDFEWPHDPVPSPRLLTAAGDRLWAADVEGASTRVYASTLRDGGAVEFSSQLVVPVEYVGGPITALAPLDGRLIVFKRSRIYEVEASVGPTDVLGDPTEFGVPALVTSDVGSLPGTPVVEVAGTSQQGLIFVSERGIRLLGRDLVVSDIGHSVRPTADRLTFTAGFQAPGTEQVYLLSAEGTALVYDLRFGTWSTFTRHAAVGGCRWTDGDEGRSVHVRDDGRVYASTSGSYLDNGSPYPMTVELGWLSFEGLQGVQRVREVWVKGRYISPHLLNLDIAYDHIDDYVTHRDIDVTGALRLSPYGDGSYGSVPGVSASLSASALSYAVTTGPGSGSWDAVIWARATGSSGDGITLSVWPTATDVGVVLTEDVGLRTVSIEVGTDSVVPPTVADLEAAFTGSTLLAVAVPDTARAHWTVDEQGAIPASGTLSAGVDDTAAGSYSSVDPDYGFRFDVPQQRCRGVRLRFHDTPLLPVSGSGDIGGSMELQEVMLRAAVEPPGKDTRLPGRKRR